MLFTAFVCRTYCKVHSAIPFILLEARLEAVIPTENILKSYVVKDAVFAAGYPCFIVVGAMYAMWTPLFKFLERTI